MLHQALRGILKVRMEPGRVGGRSKLSKSQSGNVYYRYLAFNTYILNLFTHCAHQTNKQVSTSLEAWLLRFVVLFLKWDKDKTFRNYLRGFQ